MGLLRILLRWVRTSSGTTYTARPAERMPPLELPRQIRPVAPRTAVAFRQVTEITVVEVKELLGRAYVIDGDTIDLCGTRIRLAGIDAPEMDHPYGKTAKWALVNLCKGQKVRAVFDGDLSHDRTVATCYLPDGRDLSAEMVKAGLAIDWRKFSRGKYAGLEPPGIRRKLWRCDARQKGRMPPRIPD
jgi:micrococcal nuclease